MKCEVCGNFDGPCGQRKSKDSFFSIRLRTNFEDHLNVPCFARENFNAATDETLLVETEDYELYEFKLKKKSSKTRIYGGECTKFLHDYNMKHGDMIRLDMDNPKPYLFMYPLDKYGYAKERVLGDFVFKHTVKAIVISRGLKLTPTEIGKINKHIMTTGIGLGAVFMHCMTTSDIQNNSMHIPKVIASALDIPRSSTAFLVMDNADLVVEAEYYTSSDGRIRFRNGWKKLANQSVLDVGVDVVITFHLVDDDIHIIVRAIC